MDTISSEQLIEYTDTSILPQPMVQPIVTAQYKSVAEDFIVEEIIDIDFSDEGEHLWLFIEKQGMNTAHLAKLLAKWARIPQRDVGYSGLKDRHAITTQWFSLRLPKRTLPKNEFFSDKFFQNSIEDNQIETAKILKQCWHNKKLNRSTHKRNRFTITLRDLVFPDSINTEYTNGKKNHPQKVVNEHLEKVRQQGVPNYFGTQRFGRNGNNLTQALAWFDSQDPQDVTQPTKNKSKSRKKQKSNRHMESMLLSAARSVIFNQILAKRVQDGTWCRPIQGDVFNLAGTNSVFTSNVNEVIDAEIQKRTSEMDIHPTGSLWGIGKNQKINREKSVVESSEILLQLATGLEKKKVKQSHRALRLAVNNLSWEWHSITESSDMSDMNDTLTLTLSFELQAGSYATSVLQSLVKNLH